MNASNVKLISKNSLIASFDIELASGLILRGATLHEQNGKRWVGLPAKPYTDRAGKSSWSKIIDFRDYTTKERFLAEAVAAVEKAMEAAHD